MRLPSTLMTCCWGSTRAPNLRTVSPSTSTRPAPISSSQCLRLPTPAAASTFCSRTPPGTSVSPSRSPAGPKSSGPDTAAPPRPSGARGLINGILCVLDMIWQEGGELGQLLQAGQAQPLQEIPSGPVEDSPRLPFRARILHQSPQRQRAHYPVTVHPAHRRHPRPAHRLAVGHDGEGLQRRLSEPDLLPVTDKALHDR